MSHRALRGQKEFGVVLNSFDYKTFHRGFILFAKKNTLGYSRYGFILPKKRIKLATSRNRLKRIARVLVVDFAAADGFDFVVMASKSTPKDLKNIHRPILDKVFLLLHEKVDRAAKSTLAHASY